MQGASSILPTGEGTGIQQGGRHIYWRRPDGWIVYASNSASERMDYEIIGWQPLDKYGSFVVGGSGWQPNLDPHRQILQRGGAKEFCLDEILQHGWHRKAPYDVTFPQLDGVELHDIQCPMCNRWFLDDTQMGKHTSVAHRERAQTASLAKSLADATEKSQGPLADVLKELVGRLLATNTEAIETEKDKRIATLERLLQAKAAKTA